MKAFLAACVLTLSSPAAYARTASFLPLNHLEREELSGGLNEQQFNAVIDRVEAIYKPIVARFGATLTVERRFDDPTVNAFADQPSATDWQVHMYGGLAKRPEVTEDGFAMVLCHELGHHLSGFPFIGGNDWAANEGQADMHATGACAAKVFAKNTDLSLRARTTIPANLKAQCDARHMYARTRDVCYRAIVAGKSLGDLLASLEGATVNFNTPDTGVVAVTNDAHPAAQCRLDTYVASALCGNVYWIYAHIPGKDLANRASRAAQGDAFAHSCTDIVGGRPRCWFAPK